MRLLNDFYTITSTRANEGGCDYFLQLNAGHFIYKAHFPGEPITPGVCIMQIAKELMEVYAGSDLLLSCVKNVKFLQIIDPVAVPSLCFSLHKVTLEGDTVKAQVTVTEGEAVYTKLSMVCTKKA